MLKGIAHRLLTDGSITVDLSSEFKRYSAASIARFIENDVDEQVLEDIFHRASVANPKLDAFMDATFDAEDGHYFEVDRPSLIQWAAEHKPTSLKSLGPLERAMHNVDEIIAASKALRKAKRNATPAHA